MVRLTGWLAMVLILPFFIISCGTKQVEVKPEVKRPKRERPFDMMMMQRPKEHSIFFEDDWFTYELQLQQVVNGKFSLPVSSLAGQCRYQGATYTVIDKESDAVVRVMQIEAQPCNTCHQR